MGPGMLGHVGQQLGHGKVGGRFDRAPAGARSDRPLPPHAARNPVPERGWRRPGPGRRGPVGGCRSRGRAVRPAPCPTPDEPRPTACGSPRGRYRGDLPRRRASCPSPPIEPGPRRAGPARCGESRPHWRRWSQHASGPGAGPAAPTRDLGEDRGRRGPRRRRPAAEAAPTTPPRPSRPRPAARATPAEEPTHGTRPRFA